MESECAVKLLIFNMPRDRATRPVIVVVLDVQSYGIRGVAVSALPVAVVAEAAARLAHVVRLDVARVVTLAPDHGKQIQLINIFLFISCLIFFADISINEFSDLHHDDTPHRKPRDTNSWFRISPLEPGMVVHSKCDTSKVF